MAGACACFRLLLLRRRNRIRPMSKMEGIVTPTAIPTFAPVESPFC